MAPRLPHLGDPGVREPGLPGKGDGPRTFQMGLQAVSRLGGMLGTVLPLTTSSGDHRIIMQKLQPFRLGDKLQ